MAGVAGKSGRKTRAEEMGLYKLLDDCVSEDDRRALFEALKRLAKGRSKHKLEAIKLLLAYLYGTPRQSVEVSGDEGSPLKILIEYADNQSDASPAAPGPAADQAGA